VVDTITIEGTYKGLRVKLKKTAMRNTIYILIILIIVSCQQSRHSDNPNIIVRAKLMRSYDSVYFHQDTLKHKTFDVKISIINKTGKPVSFCMMSSSWFDNFIINNDYMQFVSGTINHNFPVTKHLNMNDSLVFNASIERNNHTMYENVETTKFGFIFIDSSRCRVLDISFDSIIGDRSLHDKIIWSNPLYLNQRK